MSTDAGAAPHTTLRFRDPALQHQFERDGFLVVDLLDEDAIGTLRRLWDEVDPGALHGIYSNVHDRDLATNRYIDATITECFRAPAARVWVDAWLGGASFLVKGTGPDSASTPHQDWNNVDEGRAISASIWCPLVDVGPDNGQLVVLPGTHRVRPSIRSLDTPSLYLDFTEELDGRLVEVPCRAGQAVVYAHNLFHGSRPNLTDQVRVAAVSGVIPAHVPTVHHRRTADGAPDAFELLEVTRDFYFGGLEAMKAGRLPEHARVVGRVEVPDHRLREEEVVGTTPGLEATPVPATFADAGRQAELEERGWVVVPLLDEHEVADLREFYRSAVAADGGVNPEGAYDPTYAEFSVVHSHPEFRARAFDRIVEVVGPRAAGVLEPHRPLVANYVNKPPGTGVVPMHQNWYVVDESRFRSVSIWIALVDCTVDNGTLQFLPGSHRVLREPRGMWAYEAFADVSDLLEPQLEPVEIRAGQAIVLDDAVVHYSPPNRTAADRLAIQLIMVPEPATGLFCERVGEHDDRYVVDVWAVEPPFFWNFWHGVGDAEHGSVIDQVEVSSKRFDAASMAGRLPLTGG